MAPTDDDGIVGDAGADDTSGDQVFDDIGILFDVDGVLVHGGTAIPKAREVVKTCSRLHIPHVFVTNNAMDFEEDRAKRIEEVLGGNLPDITADRTIVAHTALADESDELKNKFVLVTGFSKRSPTEIMKKKGFKNVMSIADFAAKRPHLLPNKTYAGQSRPAFDNPDANAEALLEKETPVACVVVLETPEDWHEDLQVLVDLLRSDGRIGVPSDTQKVLCYCCNLDLVYATGYQPPRFGPGAFIECARSLYRATSGEELKVDSFGKPFPAVYAAAERRLASQTRSKEIPRRIYAIGDNPRSDIRGANEAHDRYVSVLVRTGVFEGEDNDPDHPADHVVDDVSEALRLISRLEQWKDAGF